MLTKDRKDEAGGSGECCLQLATCNHDTRPQRRGCCRSTPCSHRSTRYGDKEDKTERLPSPPPRGQSSVQTVQALKMKIEAGTPEMRRKILSNKKGESRLTPMRNGVKSRAETSLSRSDVITTSLDVVTSRGVVMTSRDSVVTSRGGVVTSRGDVTTSRDSVVTSRDSVVTSRGGVVTSRGGVVTSRTVPSVVNASSPNMSLRSEGSGRSLHNNHDEVSFTRNGAPLSTPSLMDTARTPISRTSGKQYTLGNVPQPSDHDIDYMKEELVSRLMKEKEELLKLRKRKESEREKMVELRREQECRNTDEMFDTTPEPRQRLIELDRMHYVVKETPIKSDSSSNPSQSPDSGSFSPRYRLRDTDLKSDAANRILFSEAHQRRPASTVTNLDATEKRVPNFGRESSPTKITPVSTAKISGFQVRRPAPSLTRSVDKLDEAPATPTRRVTVATAPVPTQITSLSEYRPTNFEPRSMMTTAIRPRTNGLQTLMPSPLHNSDSKINLITNGSQKSSGTPTGDFKSINNASSMSKIDSSGTPVDNSTSVQKFKLNQSEEENERFKTLPPELNSPFNERAVDCPASEDHLRKTLSLERGGMKLSPHGYDVVRTVVRTEGEEGESEINPALLQPFRRRSRKGKEANKDKCNTQ